MLEARKSRISGLLQIPKKAYTHYRTDIQRFKGPSNVQHQNTNNQLKYQLKNPQQHSYYIYRDTKEHYE